MHIRMGFTIFIFGWASGSCAEFFEQSNDGGETWSKWFEGFYTRTDEMKKAD